MIRLKIPVNWLDKFKLQIGRPYNDKDELFYIYLENATIYVFTQYLETPIEKLNLINLKNIYSSIVHAILIVATTYEENPDFNMVNDFGSLIDQKMIYKILGPFTEYFKSYYKKDDEWKNIFEFEEEIDPDMGVESEPLTIQKILDKIDEIEKINSNLANKFTELNTFTNDLNNKFIEHEKQNEQTHTEINEKITKLDKKVSDEIGETADLVSTLEERLNKVNNDLSNKIETNKTNIETKQDKINWTNLFIENLSMHNDKALLSWIPEKLEVGFGNNKIKFNDSSIILSSNMIHLTKENGDVYEPVDNSDIANKKYVDDSISNISIPDISDVAFLNKTNTFLEKNTFNKEIHAKENLTIDGNLNLNSNLDLKNKLKIVNVPEPTENEDVVNKKYVDSILNNVEIPNADNIVYKNIVNNFSNQNIFTNHSEPLVVKGNATRLLTFKNDNNSKVLEIGRRSGSNDGVVRASSNSLNLEADHNVVLRSGGGFGVQVDGDFRMGYGGLVAHIIPDDNSVKELKFRKPNKGKFNLNLENEVLIKNVPDPKANDHVVNKKYVDGEISKINIPNLENYARTDVKPTFENGIEINKGAMANYPISFPNHLTTKKYVDDKIDEKIGEIPKPPEIDTSDFFKLNGENTVNSNNMFEGENEFAFIKAHWIKKGGSAIQNDPEEADYITWATANNLAYSWESKYWKCVYNEEVDFDINLKKTDIPNANSIIMRYRLFDAIDNTGNQPVKIRPNFNFQDQGRYIVTFTINKVFLENGNSIVIPYVINKAKTIHYQNQGQHDFVLDPFDYVMGYDLKVGSAGIFKVKSKIQIQIYKL